MAELEAGRVIGSYRVVRCIGQGGMGTVYEVEHVELGVHYALKTFTFDHTNDASDALKTKFLEEGKVLARLKHPNIAHVFDLAFDEGTQMPYFVMDLVTYEDGESYTAEDVDPNDIDEEMVYGWTKKPPKRKPRPRPKPPRRRKSQKRSASPRRRKRREKPRSPNANVSKRPASKFRTPKTSLT